MPTQELLSEIKTRLQASFPERLRGVVLFGSRARAEAEPDSDVDLLVLLEDPIEFGNDLETIVQALYPLQLELDAPLHALPVSFESYNEGRFGVYRNARRDGVLL